jgi:hypothetical protein
LEAAGPEEAGDHRGEACVLEEPVEVSKSDSKERNPNKTKQNQVRNSAEKHTKK